MPIISKIKNFFTRNLAFSNSFLIKSGMPVYKTWTIKKAVKDGYKANSWVYRAVSLIAKSAASVPWVVATEEGEHLPDHHLSKLLNHPNNAISRQDTFELLVSWLELGGNAYLKAVEAQKITTELWPVSPDRLKPVLSKDISEWIQGYALDMSVKVDFETNEILHFKYFDPANPYEGLGSLQAVAKTVDIDVDQLDWNKSAMQNRGVIDGVFSFKREFRNQTDADAVAEKLNERYVGKGNARRIGVIGSEAKYTRTALTPVQMDFITSRKFNRDEIFIIFGVPPQYAGTQESSTYNNYQTSELIFWFQKIIPLLDDLGDTLTFFFQNKGELEEGQTIVYDLNNVPAIRRALLERSKTAKNLFEMGVPLSQLNKIFKFGVEEFDGWEKSYPASSKTVNESTSTTSGTATNEMETRGLLLKRDMDIEAEERENFAINKSKGIEILLGDQQEIIFSAIDSNKNQDGIVGWISVDNLLALTWSDWTDLYTGLTSEYARIAAKQIVVEKRTPDELGELIDEYLADESIVLTEISLIDKSTVAKVIDQVGEGMENGWTTSQLQQAIVDVGVFSPERALRLSRTITGTSGSIGQYISAKTVGATHKRWVTSGFNVRDAHVERGMEEAVRIDERYSVKLGGYIGPMYPLDNVLMPSDRINCRCSQIFEIRS